MSHEQTTEDMQHFNIGSHQLPDGWAAPFMSRPDRHRRPAGGEVSPPEGAREEDEARRASHQNH
jgi:hypothetical protein